jgi:hypothetical protein
MRKDLKRRIGLFFNLLVVESDIVKRVYQNKLKTK